ncbi:MAG: GFA family protein [bacterium]
MALGEKWILRTGQCLCGDIRFRVDGPVSHTSACHCHQCRRWAGHYWPSANLSTDDLVITHGADSLTWYPSSKTAERGFCIICGSSLFWRLRNNPDQRVAVALGTLNSPTGLSQGPNIHKDNKGDYYELP